MFDAIAICAPSRSNRSVQAMPRFSSLPPGVGPLGLVRLGPERFGAAAELLSEGRASVESLQAFDADPWNTGWQAAEQLTRARAAAWLGVLAEALSRQGVDVAAAEESAFLQVLQSASQPDAAPG